MKFIHVNVIFSIKFFHLKLIGYPLDVTYTKNTDTLIRFLVNFYA